MVRKKLKIKIKGAYRKVLILSVLALITPVFSNAEGQDFHISAWIPYWRASAGVQSILPNIGHFTEVNPFVYTAKLNGELNNTVSFSDSEWAALRREADTRNISFVPTVMWANADAIHTALSSPEKRQAHIRAIAREVYQHDFDGIDIDYEAKYARTRPYFSLFLKELQDAIGYDREILCTIESRTPLEDRYSNEASIPTDIEYSNDFAQINLYCDRVRIMAYDQGRFDLSLNKAKGDPYAPTADIDWVEKVMRLAAKEIDPSKLIIGVPTYGYEYDMFPALDGSGDISYSRLWSFNPTYATNLRDKLGLTITRNNAGEAMLTFPASKSPESIPLPFATRVLSWSDAESIEGKVELARKLGLAGIAIFKIDGGEDQGIWDILARAPKSAVASTGSSLPQVAETVTPITEPRLTAVEMQVPERNLELDATGEEVRTLQKLLNEAGFTVSENGPGSTGNETTIFGYATEAALIKYQKAKGITPAVGYFGPVTRASMRQTAVATSFTRNLELGDVGEDVRSLQVFLNKVGFVISPSGVGSPGQETNYFGEKTQNALIKFQKARGISPAVGYFGPITRKHIESS